MFPRTRRCLTATRTRPSVTARTSNPPPLASSQPWSRLVSSASQAAPADTSDRTPLDNGVGDIDHAPQPEQEEAQQIVKRLLSRRIAKLPRNSTPQALFSSHNRPDNAPTYQSARKALASHRIAPHAHAIGRYQSVPKGQQFDRKHVDWLHVAKVLAKIPAPISGATTDSAEVNRDQIRRYTGSCRPNAWVEAAGAGVHVDLPSEPSRRTATRPVAYTGSPVYVAVVREKHLDFIDLSASTEESVPPQDSRSVESSTVADELSSPNSRQDELASVASVATFSRFVYRLTNHHVNRSVEKDIYGDYNRYAADLLSKAFSDPRTSTHASTVALNRALLFLHNHLELLDAANLVFAHGSRMALVQNVTTCNIRLRFAFNHNIDHLAHATVREMVEARIQPNSHTWSMIYSAVRSTEARRTVVNLIRRGHAHLSAPAWSQLASTLVEEQLSTAKDSPKALSTIIEQFDKTIGPEWMTPKTLHRALHVCKEGKLNDIARDLLKVAHERSIAPSVNAHVYEFALLRNRGKLGSAVELLVSMVEDKDKIYLKMAIPRIFMTAWDRKALNVCCVLWVFAATHGLITHTMRTVVNKPLLSNSVSRTKSDGQTDAQRSRIAWQRMAARTIVGIEMRSGNMGPGFLEPFPRLSAHFSRHKTPSQELSAAEMLNQWTPDDGTRDEQISLAYVLLQRDLEAWKTFEPMALDTLSRLLREAHQKDKTWHSSGYLNNLGDKDVSEVRRECWQTLQDDIEKISEARSARLSSIRQTVLRNIEAFGLKPKDDMK